MLKIYRKNQDIIIFASALSLILIALSTYIISEFWIENKFLNVLSSIFLFCASFYGALLFYLNRNKNKNLKSEKELIEVTKTKFENLFNQSLAPTLIVDKNLIIHEKNWSFIEIFGEDDQSLMNHIVNNNSMALYADVVRNLLKVEQFEFEFKFLSDLINYIKPTEWYVLYRKWLKNEFNTDLNTIILIKWVIKINNEKLFYQNINDYSRDIKLRCEHICKFYW